jgi:ABC-type lipoprotein export system ATPase subunit
MKYLAQFHQSGGTVIMATHGAVADPFADGIIHLFHGKVVEKEHKTLK